MGIKIAALARCKFSAKGQVWGEKIIQHKVQGKGFLAFSNIPLKNLFVIIKWTNIHLAFLMKIFTL